MSCIPDPVTPRTECSACPDGDNVELVPSGHVTRVLQDILNNNFAIVQCLSDMCRKVEVEDAPTGTYTTVASDWGKYKRVDDDVTLLDPAEADIGKQILIRNTTGVQITLSSAATLNGLTDIEGNQSIVATVVAANEYDIDGGV